MRPVRVLARRGGAETVLLARSNPEGAQLLATTRDTNLMKSSSPRRDQLWFTQKDAEEAT